MSKPLLSLFWLVGLLLITATSAFAQRIVTGRVTSNEDGSGLPGTYVVVKGTTLGAATDVEGNYKINVPDNPEVILEFSSIGFKTQDKIIGTNSNIDVILELDVQELNEAVVVGYGTVQKKDLTGAVVAVSRKDFQQGLNSTPEQLIAGKMAGVQITPASGAPGSGATIRIRGGSSLSASNTPLYIIDGLPISNDGIAGVANPLASINPNDIETFTVLKDASATAIYGSRASNGVIIITTRKGTANSKPSFSFSSNNSISTLVRKLNVLSADQFRQLVNDSSKTSASLLGTSNTDWQKQIYQQAYSSDNLLSVSGGFKNIPYRISAGFLDQKGILKTDQLQRSSAALNLNPSLFEGQLKINVSLKATHTKSRFADAGAIGNAARFDPTQSLYANSSNSKDSTRYGGFFEYIQSGAGTPNRLAPKNPLGLLLQRENIGYTDRSLGNVAFDYAWKGFPELRANVNLGYDISQGYGHDKVNDSAANSYYTKGQDNQYKQRNTNKLIEGYLAYNKEVKSIESRFDVVAGYSYQDFEVKGYNYRSLTYRGDTIKGVAKPNFDSQTDIVRLLSYYGRLNYAFKNKYLFTATVRQDNSSRFAKGNRAAIFPAMAVSWRAIDEKFLQNQTILSDLKVRAGYGITGQQDIGSKYPFQTAYSISTGTATYQLGNQFLQGYRPAAVDPRIKWETTETYNAGIDYGFLKGRIFGSVDVYYRQTYNLLNRIAVPGGVTFSDFWTTNVGTLENKGVEFLINTIPVETKDFTWDLGFNITVNRNKITKLNRNGDSLATGYATGGIAGGIGANIQYNTVGQPANSFYVFQQKFGDDGKPVESKDLMAMFVDRNGDGKITDADKYIFHSPAPKFYYGVNTRFTYKKFSLSATIRGSVGGYIYDNVSSANGTLRVIKATPGLLSNSTSNILETGLRGDLNATQLLQSDMYVKSNNFIRADNVNFSYNVGDIAAKRLSLRLNFTVQNAFLITQYKGIDPEQFSGIDNNFYPRPRTYVVGLTFDFK